MPLLTSRRPVWSLAWFGTHSQTSTVAARAMEDRKTVRSLWGSARPASAAPMYRPGRFRENNRAKSSHLPIRRRERQQPGKCGCRPGAVSLTTDGHVESVQGDLGMQGLAHGPADDPAGVHAEDGGEAGPAFTGRDAGQVGKPGLTGSRRFEVAGPPVGSACWARSDSRGGCWSSGPDAAGRPALASRRGASGGLEPVFRSPGASEFSFFARTRNGRLTGTPPPPKSPPPPDTGAKQCLRRVRRIGL